MIILDIETTGLNAHKHCMVSLGAVDYATGNTFYSECCVYPESEIDDEALAINGFTREEIAPGAVSPHPDDPYVFFLKPSAHELYSRFAHWAQGFPDHKVISGHNVAHLDLPFLEVLHERLQDQLCVNCDGKGWVKGRGECIACRGEGTQHRAYPSFPFSYRTVDLHTLAFAAFGESLSSSAICEKLGIPPEPKPHNALRGARAEYACFKALLPVLRLQQWRF